MENAIHRPHPKKAQTGPRWLSLADRFPEARDCLASFLAYECAEVLAGSKPSNLINLVDRPHPCGRNFYRLWREYGAGLLARSGLTSRVLVDRGDSLLLLVYTPSQLEALLAKPAVKAMLRRAGYGRREEPAAILDQLAARCRQTRDFPHEIGIILGYPLKDVAAFMGWIKLPFAAQGAWKIYGQAEESLRLAACHRRCRNRMAKRLETCSTPVDCLQGRIWNLERRSSHAI
jgi:hypothetical protein